VVSDNKRNMVVDEISRLAIGGRYVLVAHFEARGVVFPAPVDRHKARGSGKIVDDPFRHISVFDHLNRFLESCAVDFLAAEIVCLVVLSHFQLIIRDSDAIAAQDLAQV